MIVALALAACTAPPPETKTTQEKTGPTATSPSEKTETAVYDPAKDPLVNQADMFEPEPDDPAQVAQNETLVVWLHGNPTNLNGIFQSSGVDMMAVAPLYIGPFSFDAEMNWFVVDEVVESFEESEDHLVNTVHLRPGLKWHDGTPWTAHDIRFSWEAILDERVPAPAVKDGTDQIADVRVIDDRTVQYVHKEALATNKWNMLFPIIPKHIFDNPEERAKDPTLKSSEYFNHYNRTEIIGSGAYKLVNWIPNDRLEYELWDDYPLEKPIFKRIVMKIQPDSNTTLLLVKKGELDIYDNLKPQQFALETNDEDFKRHARKALVRQWMFYYIGWNMDGSNPFFNDGHVRQAMTHALDIPKVIEKVGFNLYQPCHGIYHPDSWMYNPDIELLGYDPQRSAQLLDEAGWIVSEEDGWRYKEIDGKPVKFEFELMIPQGASVSERIAAIYGQDLKRLGISLKTRILEWAVYQQLTRKHEFQAQIAAWGTGADPDTGWNLWRTEMYDSGRNYGGYSNPRVDELFQLGREEFDEAKRAKVYQEIGKIIYDDQPYLFIWNRPGLAAIHQRIRGVQFSPKGLLHFDPSWTAWWVPANQALRQ